MVRALSSRQPAVSLRKIGQHQSRPVRAGQENKQVTKSFRVFEQVTASTHLGKGDARITL